MGGELSKDLVAGQVPFFVVEPFEVVDVEQRQRPGERFGRVGLDAEGVSLREMAIEGPAVGQTGQRVGGRFGLSRFQLAGLPLDLVVGRL